MDQNLTLSMFGALLIGLVLGTTMRRVLGTRTHLGVAASVLAGIGGAALGSVVINVVGAIIGEHPGFWLHAVAAVLGTLVVFLVATRLTRPPDRTAAEMVAAGESRLVEFKSTSRVNLHTGRRDERIELVIAKTVAALSNSAGGTLLVGVDDDGRALGLDKDLALMKAPDIDRYELWMRDFLSRTLGQATTANLNVSFQAVDGHDVCVVAVPRAPAPVFLLPPKTEDAQLWVRVGNSTRQLPVDQALAYCASQWGRRALRSIT